MDDDELLRSALAMLLESLGYAVETAQDGISGMEQTTFTPWDLVITDLVMPTMDGEAFARKMKDRHPTVPVVLISGAVWRVRKPEVFTAILAKPFTAQGMMACLDRSFPDLEQPTHE